MKTVKKVQYPMRMIILPDGAHILINTQEYLVFTTQWEYWIKGLSWWSRGFDSRYVNQ